MRFVLTICSVLSLWVLSYPPNVAPGGIPELSRGSIKLTLETPADLEVVPDERGYDTVHLPGFAGAGPPGSPMLPSIVYNVALPPDADGSTLQVTVLHAEVEDVPGTFRVAPAPPAAAWDDGEQMVSWAGAAEYIVAGQDVRVYGQEAYYPGRYVDAAGLSQMRKWRFVRLRYTPVQFNPVTGRLRMATRVELELSFDRNPALVDEALLNDVVMDDVARRVLWNYEAARRWYRPAQGPAAPQQTYDYVIVTTNAIKSGSLELAAFVAHKENQGFRPLVITEDEYGNLDGQPPNGTAEKIRQWLMDNYAAYGIEYVLLVGDPNPTAGDVPMKLCWPRRHEPSDRDAPTDYFYADLTGNWDLNANTYFGEYRGDSGPGGVDFGIEVYVGRIPVYGANYAYLDAILRKIVAYETEAGDLSWRRSALLPMSFSDASTDGACLSEWMKSTYLSPNDYTTYTLYQHIVGGEGCDSVFVSDEDLVDGAVRSHWSINPYGLVTWWAHGNAIGAYIGYGLRCSDGVLLQSSDMPYLDNDHPAFTYQCSCGNGQPENTNNLGYALLREGAIGTVSASRVSFYAVTSWSPDLKYYGDNASIGFFYDEMLVADGPAGQALYRVKAEIGLNLRPNWDGASWMNLLGFNLYGAPDTAIRTACRPVEAVAVTGPTDLLVGETGVYTATSVPLTATLPVTFTWDNGRSFGMDSPTKISSTAAYSWTQPGSYTLTVTATNRCGEVHTTFAVAVCQPLTGVVVSGPADLLVGETGVYTAASVPLTATLPITLTWDNGTIGSTAGYSWTVPGSYTVAVTGSNLCGEAGTTAAVAVLCQQVEAVEIGGPASLLAGETGLYTATYAPLSATLPLTLTWDNGAVGATAAYSWTVPGIYTLTITATNPCGEVGGGFAVEVSPQVRRIYLPLVVRGG